MSCASDLQVVTETKTVEKKVEVYRPLPDSLVDPIPYPQALSERFTQDDLIDTVFRLYDLLDSANDDRASAGRIVRGENGQ